MKFMQLFETTIVIARCSFLLSISSFLRVLKLTAELFELTCPILFRLSTSSLCSLLTIMTSIAVFIIRKTPKLVNREIASFAYQGIFAVKVCLHKRIAIVYFILVQVANIEH